MLVFKQSLPWFHPKPPENSCIPAVIKHLKKASGIQPLCQASTSYYSQQSEHHKLQNPSWWVKQRQKTKLDLCGKEPLGSSPRQTHGISCSQQPIATFHPCGNGGEHTHICTPATLNLSLSCCGRWFCIRILVYKTGLRRTSYFLMPTPKEIAPSRGMGGRLGHRGLSRGGFSSRKVSNKVLRSSTLDLNFMQTYRV